MTRMIYLIALLAFIMCMVNGIATKPQTNLDKNGTTAWQEESRDPQALEVSVVAHRGSLNAEREGFEPSVHLRAHRFSRPARSAALAPLRNSIFPGFYRCRPRRTFYSQTSFP
jgi:hypothetical protein